MVTPSVKYARQLKVKGNDGGTTGFLGYMENVSLGIIGNYYIYLLELNIQISLNLIETFVSKDQMLFINSRDNAQIANRSCSFLFVSFYNMSWKKNILQTWSS